MTLAADLASEITTRLSAITVVNGYATDVGTNVYRGKRRLSPDDVPFITLLEGDDRVEDRALKNAKLAQQYTAEAHAVCDPDNPNDTAHQILGDLKKAIFSGDKRFGGRIVALNYIGRSIGARDDGTDIAFASVSFELVFSEDLANP